MAAAFQLQLLQLIPACETEVQLIPAQAAAFGEAIQKDLPRTSTGEQALSSVYDCKCTIARPPKNQISLDDVYKMGQSVYFCGFLALLLENPYFPSNETRAQALERFWKFATGIAAVLQNHKAEIARHLNVVKATKAMLTQPKAWDCLLQLGLAMSMDSCLSTVAFCRRVLLLR